MVAPGDAFTDSNDEGDGWDGGDDIDIEFAKVLETRAGMSAGPSTAAVTAPHSRCRPQHAGAPDESFGYDTPTTTKTPRTRMPRMARQGSMVSS